MTTKQTTTKKMPLKRLISIIAIAIMLFALAIPCFAWTSLPVSSSPDTYAFAYKSTSPNTYVIYAWGYDGITYAVMTDDRYFELDNNFWYNEYIYVPVGVSAPTEAQARVIVNNYLNAVRNGAFGDSMEQEYADGYNDGYEIGQQDGYNWGYDIGEQNGYLQGVEVSYDVGYNNGYADGHAQGETDGLNTAEAGKNLILTIFSVPTYVLSNVFNFEIFGINLYSLICFLLTISIVGIVLKKIL